MDGGTLGWEIIAKKNTPGIPGKLEDMYRKLCGGVVLMLSRFGIEAFYRPLNDVEIGGRKISGAGGTELEDSFIFHGTVLVDFSAETMVNALKLPLIKLSDKQVSDFKTRTVCMRELLGYAPPIEEVKSRLAEAFAETLDVEFEAGGLSEREIQHLRDELPLFSSDEWIYGRETRSRKNSLKTSEHKAAGGLIRVSLLLDDTRGFIKTAFITGDFFTYPERGILALESVLKNSSVRPEVITRKINDFFASQSVRIPGAGAEDFTSAVLGAVQERIENGE
jgi:lipoate-protein ligase A